MSGTETAGRQLTPSCNSLIGCYLLHLSLPALEYSLKKTRMMIKDKSYFRARMVVSNPTTLASPLSHIRSCALAILSCSSAVP